MVERAYGCMEISGPQVQHEQDLERGKGRRRFRYIIRGDSGLGCCYCPRRKARSAVRVRYARLALLRPAPFATEQHELATLRRVLAAIRGAGRAVQEDGRVGIELHAGIGAKGFSIRMGFGMTETVRVEGLKEVLANLKKVAELLGYDKSKSIVRSSLRKAGKVLQKQAQDNLTHDGHV